MLRAMERRASGVTLQKLGDHIRQCYERAAESAELASTERDERMKEKLLKIESTWIHLAKSYEFVQSLETFLLDAHRRMLEGKDALGPSAEPPT